MDIIIKLLTSDTFWTAIGSSATFLAVLYVVFPDKVKNFFSPVNLSLEILDKWEEIGKHLSRNIEYIPGEATIPQNYYYYDILSHNQEFAMDSAIYYLTYFVEHYLNQIQNYLICIYGHFFL